MLDLVLPYPPSVNRYWRKWNNRMVISDEGRKYKAIVGMMVKEQRAGRKFDKAGRISVAIEASPPDKRRRDLDNLLKATLDAIADGCGFDDSQIDSILIERGGIIKDGQLAVRLWNC